jgi:hypothetical protein
MYGKLSRTASFSRTASNEGGMLGVAASPSFVWDQTVFVFYTTKVDSRFAKLRLGGRPQPIVTG